MKTKTLLLLSGGLDSVTAFYQLVKSGDVHCLLVNYGQPHSKELWFAERHCKKLSVPFTVIDLPKLGGLTDNNWIVPNRNCILLSLAVNLAIQIGAGKVAIAVNRDDEAEFPDCRMAFVQLFNTTLTTAEINVEVITPLIEMSKRQIFALAKTLGVVPEETWWCYRGKEKPCGNCPACKKMENLCTM